MNATVETITSNMFESKLMCRADVDDELLVFLLGNLHILFIVIHLIVS